MVGKALLAGMGLIFAVAAAQAQGLRCDLAGRDTTLAGTLGKACLDLRALEGQTLVIPSNVTRLDREGLALCRNSLRVGGSVDLVFIADQNNSMWARTAYLGTAGDTVYFAGNNGCGGSVTEGSVVVPTLEVPTTVPQRLSMDGCTDFSGDPLNVRGVAIRSAMDYMASVSSASTAGYIGFGGNIADEQPPLQLGTAANVEAVKGKVVLRSLGGANYNSPLERVKTWLNDTSLIRTGKQAVVFISNGAHQNQIGGYVSKVDADMPPIYTIFMGGRAPSDTINLKKLSQLSGGIYYRVPPERPDSLQSVLRSILDLLLQDFDPTSVRLTNTSISPAQTSVSAGLAEQGDGVSWRVHLDSALGLVPNAANNLVLVSEFRELRSGSGQIDTASFTVSTTGPAAGGSRALTGGLQARCFELSRLAWTDPAGERPAYFTEADSLRVRLRLRASDSSLSSATAAVSTRRPVPDAETAGLPRLQIFRPPDSTYYLGAVPMRVRSAATAGNAVLEPFGHDSLIARWVHPRDPQDAAQDTLPVRPSQAVAQAWFSADSAGAPVSRFDGNPVPPAIWVVVSDNQATPGLPYAVTVSSDSQGVDQVTLILVQSSPGVFTVRVPFDAFGSKLTSDAILQVAPTGDLLRAVYVDPFYGDRAEAAAGYGIKVQEPASLVFTREDGTSLPDSAFWPMGRGRVFLRYSDDAAAALASKPLEFRVTGLKLSRIATTDKESAALTAVRALTATATAWSDSFATSERPAPVEGNGVLEGAWRMVITAVARAHDNLGNPTGQAVSRSLILAHADSVPSLTFTEHVHRSNPEGPVNLVFTLRDQDFVLGATDTVTASALCPASSDSVAGLRLVQSAPGVYVSDTLFRDGQGANPTDRVLSCPSGGDLVLRYVDPVFGGTMAWTLHEAAMPVASPPAGTAFVSQLGITLATATSGAAINHTLDGSLPRPDRPVAYAGPFPITEAGAVKAVASKPGYLRSWVMTADYVRQAVQSRIRILDSNGFALPNRTVTDAATALRLSVVTTQGGLGAASARIRSLRKGDAEAPLLASTRAAGGAQEYWDRVAFRVGAGGQSRNDTLDATLPDTLIATWRNPFDTSVVVADTAFVAAAYAASTVHFSDSLGGRRVDSVPAGTGTVYVVVQAGNLPGAYSVLASSGKGGADAETFSLALVRPGVYSAAIPLAEAAKASGDGTLQVSAVDQITARFIHPVFLDTTYGSAGYGEAAQVPAALVFLDGDGKALPQDAWYSPAQGRIRVRYTDDYAAALQPKVGRKELRLVLQAYRESTLLGSDSERVDLDYDSAAGAWVGESPLRDRSLLPGNDTLETRYRGELTASVVSHDREGNADGGTASRRLRIAYPDQGAGLVLADAGGGEVGRGTTGMIIRLSDQPFTRVAGDSVRVRLGCEVSGDRENGVWLIGDGLGNYVLEGSFPKVESVSGSVAADDGKLACRDADKVFVEYVDPVFGSTGRTESAWRPAAYLRLRFASAADSATLLAVNDGAASRFLAIAEADTPDRNRRDTLWIVLATPQGDKETLPAVETGEATGVFVVSVPFAFGRADPVPANGRMDGRLDPALAANAVLVTGTVRRGADSARAGVTLVSQLNAAARGYALDRDGDGRAETVALVFTRKLDRIPAALDSLYWNAEAASNRRSASGSALSLSADSLTLRADLAANPFGRFLTGIPSGARPVAVLPGGGYFGGFRVALEDSVGPVPVKAVKLPSGLATVAVGDERRFEPDTLIITVSEAVRTALTWQGVFRFGKASNCGDSGAILASIPIPTLRQAAAAAGNTEFTLLVDNTPGSRIPLKGDCIFLDHAGLVSDLEYNAPGRLGVVLEGRDPVQVIRGVSGYPPVAGLNPAGGTYFVANSGSAADDRSMQVMGSGQGLEILWVPPVDFPAGWRAGDAYRPAVDVSLSDSARDATEAQGLKTLPGGISVVQVVTSGRYIAHVSLFDNHGRFVKGWKQKFGFDGELRNTYRITNQGVRSFLVWDRRDTRGGLAGNGAYVWKVVFQLDGGRQEVRFVTTGLVRD